MGFLYTGLAAGVTTPHPSHSTPRSPKSAYTQCVARAPQPSSQKVPGHSHPASAILVNGILWLNRQCYLMGMVVGFAELGGTIGLFPSAMPWGLRLTLELRLVFEPKILLFQPPAHWRLRLLLSLRGLLWLNHKALLLHMQMK